MSLPVGSAQTLGGVGCISGSTWLGAGWGHLQGGGGPRAAGTTPGAMIWACPASSTPAATAPKPRELEKQQQKAFLLKYSVHTDKCVYHECSILSTFLKLKYLCGTQIQNQNPLAPPEPLLFFLPVYTPDPRVTPSLISGTINKFSPAFELLFIFKNFVYFWLHWVFVAVCGLSSLVVAASGGYARVVVRGLLFAVASCRARALAHAAFGSCSSQAQLPCSMWDLPGPEFRLCIARGILNHWTTREIPDLLFKGSIQSNCKQFHSCLLSLEIHTYCCMWL